MTIYFAFKNVHITCSSKPLKEAEVEKAKSIDKSASFIKTFAANGMARQQMVFRPTQPIYRLAQTQINLIRFISTFTPLLNTPETLQLVLYVSPSRRGVKSPHPPPPRTSAQQVAPQRHLAQRNAVCLARPIEGEDGREAELRRRRRRCRRRRRTKHLICSERQFLYPAREKEEE